MESRGTGEGNTYEGKTAISEKLIDAIKPECDRVRALFVEQHEALKERPFFERMWALRDFNEHAGM